MIIYEGPSLLDGSPIVAIGTHNSRNAKTGNMLQTWIMRQDVPPNQATRTGQDSSVCGDCPLRPIHAQGVSCYVKTWQAPLAVWKRYRADGYPLDLARAPVRGVRIGSYGDPAAVPVHAWEALLAVHSGLPFTGYTHQWHKFPELRPYCMASCDTPAEARAAQGLGWRTFRIADKPVGTERLCPASKPAGHKLTCAACVACSGSGNRASIYIPAH